MTTYDRAKEVREFDDSNLGVKGLLDSGITAVPRIFHHPQLDPTPVSSTLTVPTVDLSLPRSALVPLLSSASRDWGFFQVTNHGIPLPSIASALQSVRSFFELPTSSKSPFYSRGSVITTGFSYSTNFDLHISTAATWRDTLQIRMAPVPAVEEKVPEECRAGVFEWDAHVKEVAERLVGLLAEGLGVGEGRLNEMSLLDGRTMVCHYYPRCPQPELTLGLAGHTDPGMLTVLVQNEVQGLQVRKKGEDGAETWVDVVTIPGALVVNVGDLFQMISNDGYKSVVHRVVANPHDEARVSIAVFINTGKKSDSDIYGPLPGLISEATPARYKNFTMTEFMKAFFGKQLSPGSLIDNFKI